MDETGLKRIRGELGLTEEAMAKRLTVSYSTYRNAEKTKASEQHAADHHRQTQAHHDARAGRRLTRDATGVP